ncbi:MAG: DNA polymerase IV [Kiritimatiellia bacterium]|nr:DNA polymerase IV [Kiritimatiellia bacterium]
MSGSSVLKRIILHVDMDAFYAAIEQRDHPDYRGKPVVVGAQPDQRGVVATASYEARVFGIHSAMSSQDAGRRCPHAIFVPPDLPRYKEVSHQVFAIFDRYTPLVQGLSIDEAFLDVSGSLRLFGSGEEIARRIKGDIQRELGLTCSIGIAPNKFLAKLGSEYQKPDGLTVLPFDRAGIIEFLRPLPVTRLWGVGKVTHQAFDRAALYTIGDIQDAPPALLESVVGAHLGAHLRALAFGEDSREIELDLREKSISREHTFMLDERTRRRLDNTLFELVEDVARRLRADGRLAATGRLKVRWKDFSTLTRQRAFPCPTRLEEDLHAMATALFKEIPLEQPVRLIGFGISGLMDSDTSHQLDLFDLPLETRTRKEHLDQAVDQIRAQHGRSAIRRARTLPPPHEES